MIFLKKETFVKFLALTAALSLLVSCATPRAMLSTDASINKNDTIYFLSSGKDPRNIFPKVVTRLKNLGFDVKEIIDESINSAQGTGFIVSNKGHILTSAHLFKDEKTASLWVKGKRYDASIINKDAKNDLALLKINAPKDSFEPLSISKTTTYKMGQDIYTIGFPLSDILGNSPRLNKGLISSTVGLKDDPNQIQITAEIQPGNSGGPLINNEGNIIGIIQSTLNPINVLARTGNNLPQNVNFASKVNMITEFLEKNLKNVHLPKSKRNSTDFDQVSRSIVQVRAGNVTEEYLNESKIICKVSYESFWDLGYRFRFLDIEFFDPESGRLILKAGQYRDSLFAGEDAVLDETFMKIKEKLFSNQ